MTKTSAVIFDVDGTLLDSVDQHANAWVDVFREFGHQFPFEKVRAQIGKGGDQVLPLFLSEQEVQEKGKKIEARRGEILKNSYLEGIVAFASVRTLVKKLLDDGIQVALASSAKEDELETYKKIAGIDDLIKTQASSADADHSKPFPDIFKATMARLSNVPPNEIVVIGDTPYDAQAAMKAGLTSLGVLCGGWSEAELRKAGCAAVYANPDDLLNRYRTWVLKNPA